MIECLSPRELEELERACGEGRAWARVIRDAFLEGTRLRLGLERARTEGSIAEVSGIDPEAVRPAVLEAARWCDGRGLHLMGFPAGGTGEEWQYLLAVG
ncbi:MAG: hypothetical protein ACE5JH_10855 [Acidobacteriota bacterium]